MCASVLRIEPQTERSRCRPDCVSDMGIYRSKLADMRMAENLPTPKNRNICRLSLSTASTT